MDRKSASDFPQELLNLFDGYVHGGISRRNFLDGAQKFAVGGVTAAALFQMLKPNYAWAIQVPPDDKRIKAESATVPSPQGYGSIKGYLARPANATKLPTVLVIHENRGLNPYTEDVARRLAVADFIAFAPDALTSLGGYPGTDEVGVEMQRKLEQPKMMADFVATARYLKARPDSTGRIGVTGFCFGGGIANNLAVQLGPDMAASAPFYGGQPRAEDVPKIKAAMLIHYAEDDMRINAGWPAYEAALKANKIPHQAFFYPGTMHGFFNDTTPRFNKEQAAVAWTRTLDHFNKHVKTT